jgi:uncharacterized membrane protein
MRYRWAMQSRVLFFAAVCLAIGSHAGAQQDKTGFTVCNRTGLAVEVAKAVFSNRGAPGGVFVAEGWYQFADGQCRTLWTGKLEHRYYLLYAQHKTSGREWKGDIPVCVERDAFTLRGASCPPDKYRRLFFQVDTADTENWTYTFRP